MVNVYDNPIDEGEESAWGPVVAVFIVAALLAGIAYGPSIVKEARKAFADGTRQISTLPGLNFESFDEQISRCLEANEPLTYDVVREYQFPFDGRTWTWSLQLSTDIYNCLASPEIREGFGRFDYAQYVTARFDDRTLESIIQEFRDVQAQEGYGNRELAAMVLSFVQHLVYAADDVTTPYDEWPRFPLETLYAQGGDCEDTSILYASLIKAMGYGPVLLAPPGHMAVGLPAQRTTEDGVAYQGTFYAFAETTGEGFRIGDMPSVYEGVRARVFEI